MHGIHNAKTAWPRPALFGLFATALSFAPLHAHACAPLNNPCGIYDFRGKVTGGAPQGGVILGPDNTLYGETSAGGTAPCHAKYGDPRDGCGTVYSISATGGFKVLVSFHGPNGAYGLSNLTLVGNTLYGATERGGEYNKGVIFSVNTDGRNFTLLHQFNGTDGSDPHGPFIPGPNGSFYGFTVSGGPNFPAQSPGVIFSLSPAGTYNILHVFSKADGYSPTTLVMTPSGILVGGTFFGGPTNPNYCSEGCGVVFSFDPATSQYTVLKTYDGTTTSSPYIGSVAPDGTIYGNDEALFSITLAGNYQVLALSNIYFSGETPESGPILAPDGTLYGTYSQSLYGGTAYSYSPSNPGVLNTVCIFNSYRAGNTPYSQPIIAPNGDLIGTTYYAGTKHYQVSGAIYECTP